MVLVEFTGLDGQQVFVNVKHVAYVTPHGDGNNTYIQFSGSDDTYLAVQGEPGWVAREMQARRAVQMEGVRA